MQFAGFHIKKEWLIDPRKLKWISTKMVQQSMQGLHMSAAEGRSYTFSHYKNYQPGEDLRLLDWKMYGKTDKFYIKVSEADQRRQLVLLVDTSASMAHETGLGYTKFEYLKLTLACLVQMAAYQGDGLLLSFAGEDFQQFHYDHVGRHQDQIFYRLSQLEAKGQWVQSPRLLRQLEQRINQQDAVLFFSDWHEQAGEISGLAEILLKWPYDKRFIQLLANNELEQQFESNAILVDLESGQEIQAANRKRSMKSYVPSWAASRAEFQQWITSENPMVYLKRLGG
ncbi:MAG: DUF58 domain-containing protein [Cyclobacteriaceae bacterium]|nr:DUF58 domain-containing protein [Cyclobacteriaceae bacterium]